MVTDRTLRPQLDTLRSEGAPALGPANWVTGFLTNSNRTPAESAASLKEASQYDGALGLWMHGSARVTNGKFWYAEDPKGFDAGDSNLRRLVGNSPVNRID